MPVKKNYSDFLAEDFASDPYFQKWILEDDHMTDLFWEKWFMDNPHKHNDIDLAKKIVSRLTFKQYKASSAEYNEVWKNIRESQVDSPNPTVFFRLRWYIGIAASVAILISFGIFFSRHQKNNAIEEIQNTNAKVIENNIKTGTDKAILTLANGLNVELVRGQNYETQDATSNGKEIIYHPNAIGKEIVYNYLTTPQGAQFFAKLSDGTQVWLNSETQLKYPVNFKSGEVRQVELIYGEVYFDVSHSTKHKGSKFRVINQGQEVEVLGTQFNIKAYRDEPEVYTTLVEGKVRVKVLNMDAILNPKQQLQLNLETNKTSISVVDVYRVISWKNGVFSFKNKPLKDIMKVLSRWYDIEVVFENKTLENSTFSGTLKKKLNINEILETITSFNNINYKINDKTVILK